MATRAFMAFVLAAAVSGFAYAGESGPEKAPAVPCAKPAVDFLLDVMPVINKMGCNAVACHAAAKGNGGFRLSMFGANPQADFEALTKADGGRRINKVETAKSLFLLKATGALKCGSTTQKLQVGSPQYAVLEAWIAGGAPLTHDNAPALSCVAASPVERILQKCETQQLCLTANFSDGSHKNVTDAALFSTSDASVATVDGRGLITAKGCGQATIIASYLRQPAMIRIVVPQVLPMPFPQPATNGKIDELVLANLKLLGIPPAELCTEPQFLRRVYLDVTGTLPTADEARAYLADRDPQKRSKLIDKLLNSEEFADYWAMKWADLFRIKSEFPVNLWPNAVQAYHRWVRESIASNKPYDQFARELLTATGSDFRDPPANFYRGFLKKDPQDMAEVAALTFMGARIGCARCHGHPTENWTLDDNLSFSAFFSQLKFKITSEWKEEIVYVDAKQVLRHPRTGELVKPRFLGEPAVVASTGQSLQSDAVRESQKDQDNRVKFANWLTSPGNPWFARNIANRTWYWLLGRGIVHEPDDLRPTNPPENPQLLDYLARELVDHKYDLKHVYRLILNSRTYQLSAGTNEWNQADVAHFSHYYVKRLGAETLLDAIGQVTGKWDTYQSIIPEPFVVMPPAFRATHLADGSISLPFLELFGRPPRDTAYESERDLHLYQRQTLHLLNSSDVQNKISTSPFLAGLLKDVPEDAKIIDALYLTTLSRPATPEEKEKLLAYVTPAGQMPSESFSAEKAAAASNLAQLRKDLADANANFARATREAKEAVAKAALASAPAATHPAAPPTTREGKSSDFSANSAKQIAAAKAAAKKLAAEKRKQLASAKAVRDKLAAGEKPAVAALAAAGKKLDAAIAEAHQRREQAYQDVLWALLNTKEFVFNH